jgi:maltodextrin utilization protein YvdJ
MEKPNLFTQVYGYIVCLITIITILICATNLVTAVIDKTDPIHSGYSGNNSAVLVSFEYYKLDLVKSFQSKEGMQYNQLPDDATLRKTYEAARQDKIDKVNFESNRTIIVTVLLIIISSLLFITHWRLARKNNKQPVN